MTRRTGAPLVVAAVLALLSGCSSPATPPSGPPTPSLGSESPATTSVSASPSVTSTSPAADRPEPRSPLIVIDPGHSGTTIRSTATNGLRDIDYPNYPEIYEMFDVSGCVAEALGADGYRVKMTKTRALSNVSHAHRAAVANDNHADLAISVHDDHSAPATFEHTYDQRGTRRSDGSYPVMYRGTGSHRTVFADQNTAKLSQTYARVIAEARTRAQHRPVTVTQNSYDGRAPLEPGNLALVQLFSTVPWVYNEMGARTAGSSTQAMSIASETEYAEGLLAGVEAAVPLVAGRANPRTRSASRLQGCLVRQVEPTPGHLTRPQRYLPYGFG